MYTSDGWGTLYKIDARSPNKGEFVWVTDPGVKHQGNVPRTRGIALWEDLVIANLPDGRVIAVNRNNGGLGSGLNPSASKDDPSNSTKIETAATPYDRRSTRT